MGGAEIFTYEVLKRWADRGHEITMFASEFFNCKKKEKINNIKVFRAGGKYSVYQKAKSFYEKIFSKEKYDFIIDEINTKPFFTPKFVCHGERIVALIHQMAKEYWFYETPFPLSYIGYYFLEKRWLKNYVNTPTVTVSESTKRDLNGLGFEKVFVVSEGLNFKPLKNVPKKEKNPVIVFVGRLKRAKRPDHAIKAFSTVKEYLPKAELWIIGKGYFKKKIAKMKMDGVKFYTPASNKERRELIKRSWVLVNPSIREGWGLNVLEANALGVPCVAYNVAGLCDSVLHGETGLLADNGNVEDLAKKLLLVLKNDVLRERLSANALNYSRRFSWDKTAAEFINVLKLVWDER